MREQRDRVTANLVCDSFINLYQRRDPTSSPGSAFPIGNLFNVSASKQEGQNPPHSNLRSAKIFTRLYYDSQKIPCLSRQAQFHASIIALPLSPLRNSLKQDLQQTQCVAR
jgi:hypothetical protein